MTIDPIVHVGLPKTATTALQRHVFRDFARQNNRNYWGKRKSSKHVAALQNADVDIFPLNDRNIFVSNERLVGSNPLNWQEYAEKNRVYFGESSTIVLVLREPKSYLRSIYLQVCVHEGRMLKPDEFFVSGSTLDPSASFDLSSFSYRALIHHYSSRFNRVIVQKFETISDFRLLNTISPLSEQQHAQYENEFKLRLNNRSYSARAVNLSFAMFEVFKRYRQSNKVFSRRLRHRVWRKIMQGVLDKLLPYKHYTVDWSKVQGACLDEYSAEYESLPDFQDLHR